MKTSVYIDGFNLYYGSLKGTAYKWLNLEELCDRLLKQNRVTSIKYFTAMVSARPDDPGAPQRQQMYLRALRTLQRVEVIMGHFRVNERLLLKVNPPKRGSRWARVLVPEEKKSDVNIAAHMINDGYRNRYQCAVLISNDSDLLEPVRMIRDYLGKRVGIVSPQDTHSSDLRRHAMFLKRIRRGLLKDSQFPDELDDEQGTFHKPPAWNVEDED